jgi:fluoride ion exporter CrcB/FEX
MQRVNGAVKNNGKVLRMGVFLALAGVLLAVLLLFSFRFEDSHRWYWHTAPILGVLGALAAFSGGFLVGNSINGIQRKHLWIVLVGGIIGGLVVMVTN